MKVPKNYYINDSTFDFIIIELVINLLFLTYIIASIFICHIFQGADVYLLEKPVFGCKTNSGESLLWSLFLMYIPMLFLPNAFLKLRIKKEIGSKKTPIISIFENSIEIPLVLKNQILLSDLRSIQYQLDYPFSKLIVESSKNLVFKKNMPWWRRGLYFKCKPRKLVWFLPHDVNFVLDLEQDMVELQNRINNQFLLGV